MTSYLQACHVKHGMLTSTTFNVIAIVSQVRDPFKCKHDCIHYDFLCACTLPQRDLMIVMDLQGTNNIT